MTTTGALRGALELLDQGEVEGRAAREAATLRARERRGLLETLLGGVEEGEGAASDGERRGGHRVELGLGSNAWAEANFSAWELRSVGFDAARLKAAGCGTAELREARFSVEELLAAGFGTPQLLAAGFDEAQIKAAGGGVAVFEPAGKWPFRNPNHQ